MVRKWWQHDGPGTRRKRAIHTRQVLRQGSALGSLARRCRRLLLAQQFLKLRLGRGDVGVHGLVEQRALFGIELLALLAELQAPELGNLESKPVNVRGGGNPYR